MNTARFRSGTHPLGAAALEDATRELEVERQCSRCLAALLKVLGEGASLAASLNGVLAALADVAGSPSALLWLSEAGEDARVRATLGERAERALEAKLPAVELDCVREPRLLAASDALACALCQADKPLLCLPLRDGSEAFVGAACLELEPDGLERLALSSWEALSHHAAVVIAVKLSLGGLDRALRARDDVLGMVAHDLRNPINVIAMAAHGLVEQLQDPRLRGSVEKIVRAAQRADHQINDLLDISAIESGHFLINKRPLDATRTVLSAIDSQQTLARAAGIVLASDVSPGLPLVEADEERLLEVLENLVGNTLKFCPAGSTTTIGASASGEEVTLWVQDTGPGISDDELPHLFDRFWQGKKGDPRGTGLGLAISRTIVEAHGGHIWAERAPRGGTAIYFTLPLHQRISQHDLQERASILLVDDNPQNLLSLKAILGGPEYRLVTAKSGEEALRLVLREQFALALIDVAMPGMDGFEVALQMKQLRRSRDIPIIFVTAFGEDAEQIHRAYAVGGADYLLKPLDPAVVRKKVAVFVGLRRQAQRASAPSNWDLRG